MTQSQDLPAEETRSDSRVSQPVYRPNETVSREIDTRSADFFDVLEPQDLDEALAEVADGSPLHWGIVLQLARPGPEVNTEFIGADWQITIITDKPFELPRFKNNQSGVSDRIDPPLALIEARTGETTVNAARDIGRPRARALVGYVRLVHPLFTGASLAWEGFVRPTNTPGEAVYGTGTKDFHLEVSAAALERVRPLLPPHLNIGDLCEADRLALEWVTEAWLSTSTQARFTNLWFAVVATVDARLTKKEKGAIGGQMARIRCHLLKLPISTASLENLREAFTRAYDLRNKVVHEGYRGVNQQDVANLYDALSNFLRAEIGRSK